VPASAALAPCSIFWDVENVQIPQEKNALDIYHLLQSFIHSKKWQLSSIQAVGNVGANLSVKNQSFMRDCGIVLQNISSANPCATDLFILGELIKLVWFNKVILNLRKCAWEKASNWL
jgi:hypothetical protein